jgi:Family of unknown function (DUF6962)
MTGLTLELFGVSIHEADVALTDVGLAILGSYLGWRLWSRPERSALERRGAIIMVGLAGAALWGAIFHAFFPDHTATPMGFSVWMLVVLSILVVSVALLELALEVLATRLPPTIRHGIVAIYALAFAIVVFFRDESFTSIVRFYGPALLLVLIAAVERLLRTRSTGWRLIAVGFTISIGAAVLQQAHVGLDPVYFNHNAVYHVLQGVALVLLYLGFQRALPVSPGVPG